VNEQQARQLEVAIKWNGKANVCVHCGRVPETFYIVTGHDHTDDAIRWCPCREKTDKQRIAELEAQLASKINLVKKLGVSLEQRVIERDTALRQVARLREALEGVMPYTIDGTVECRGDKCRERWCLSCNTESDAMEAVSDALYAFGKVNEALSEIPSPGVLCESEPVAWMNAKGDMTYLHGPYNADDIPLHKPKEV
jgi:uncharacterized coiled-coil protein SlyX